jgi:hypothetical protein
LAATADSHGKCKRIGVTLPLRLVESATDVQGGTMSLQARLESLKTRHASLDNLITLEDQRPRPDASTLAKLKLEKLKLKEEMTRLRGTTA